MIKKYNQFLNESILDELKGPSEEDLINYFNTLSVYEIFNFSIHNHLLFGFNYAIKKGLLETYNIDELIDKALLYGNIDITKILVEHGGIIQNKEEKLINALKLYYFNVVEYLIEQGADIHINNDEPIRIATERRYLNMIKYLVEHGADIHTNYDYPLRFASDNGYIDVVMYLVEQGADIHAQNDGALRHAAHKGHLDIVKYLVKHGADIHVYDDQASKVAFRNNKYMVADYLVSLSEKEKITEGLKDYLTGPTREEMKTSIITNFNESNEKLPYLRKLIENDFNDEVIEYINENIEKIDYILPFIIKYTYNYNKSDLRTLIFEIFKLSSDNINNIIEKFKNTMELKIRDDYDSILRELYILKNILKYKETSLGL